MITSIVQEFDDNAFNFKKVDECEVLLRCHDQLDAGKSKNTYGIVTFLVNNSPLTKYHSLICPRVNENLSQIMTKECIEFAIDLITGLDDRSYRLGYNSLGALASVNHLHLHLIHIPENLYIEDAVSMNKFYSVKTFNSTFIPIEKLILFISNNIKTNVSIFFPGNHTHF